MIRVLTLTLLALVGCETAVTRAFEAEPDADLSDEAVSDALLLVSTPPEVESQAWAITLLLLREEWPDPDCPTVVEGQGGLRVTGGCTSRSGVTYEGDLSLVTGSIGGGGGASGGGASGGFGSGRPPSVSLSAYRFAITRPASCIPDETGEGSGDGVEIIRVDGTFEASANAFDLDLLFEGGVENDDPACQQGMTRWGARYAGRIDQQPWPGTDFFPQHGRGELIVSPYGRFDARTDDLLVTTCTAGPITGHTALTSASGSAELDHEACGGLDWLEE